MENEVKLPERNRLEPHQYRPSPDIVYKFCTYERFIEIRQREYNLTNTLITNFRRK
jgi:hypothetical protein